MGWPHSQDYNEAIQSPARNFADPDLRAGQAVINTLGLPMPFSGNFADVYEIRCPDGQRWAVKCFTREVSGLHQRYDAISRHLRRVKLPLTVDFSYLEQGIRVAGHWYPVLKMEWVEGLTLNQFVARAADKPGTLEALLRIWGRMARHLRESETAHGDLQHGNVMLVPETAGSSLALKLVDYDGMFVPALAGNPSSEVGHPSYQHPQRASERAYNLEVDRFPLLLIATALAALKVKGRALWEKYDDGDNLLFRQQDLEAPSKSVLFSDLLKLDEPQARFLAENLIDAARKPLAKTPLLEELLSTRTKDRVSTATRARAVTITATATATAAVTAEPRAIRRPIKERSTFWRVLVGGAGFFCLLGVGALILLATVYKPGATARDGGDSAAKPNLTAGGDLTTATVGQARPGAVVRDDPTPKQAQKPDGRPCGGCERGAPFDGPYDISRQCRLCWLFHNNADYRKLWGGDGPPDAKGTPAIVRYLDDMREYDVVVSERRFAKNGMLGYSAGGSDKIRVNGKEYPHALSMHALSNASAAAKYKLEKASRTFVASVALNDSAVPPPSTPLTFTVLGDGKVLWKSEPVKAARQVQECTANVNGVGVLELRVDCPGPNVNAQAVWLEARVLLN
jgi:hypothetical protein